MNSIDRLETLENFLKDMITINSNPYTKGLDIDVLLKDLVKYVNDLKEIINEEKNDNIVENEE